MNNDKKTLDNEDNKPEWYEAHKVAIQNNQHYYNDPITGYKVMTELHHKSRGYCCGNKCRHCPFNHENVGKEKVDIKRVDSSNIENKEK